MAATKTKKRTPAKKKKTAAKAPAFGNKQIGEVISFTLSVLVAAVVFINAGGLWGVLRNFFFGVFGFSAFVLPFYSCFLTIVSATGKATKNFKYKVFEGTVLYTLIVGFIHIVKVNEALGYGEQIRTAYLTFQNYSGTGMRFGTGVYGALFGGLPFLVTGGNKLAAGVIALLLIFVVAMLFTGTTLVKLLHSLKTPADTVGDYAETKVSDMKETYETVAADRDERKARKARENEENRRKREQEEEKPSAIDVPVDDSEKPDMGINDIFTEAALEKNGIRSLKDVKKDGAGNENAAVDLDRLAAEADKNPAVIGSAKADPRRAADAKIAALLGEINTPPKKAATGNAAEKTPDDKEKHEYVLPSIECLDLPKNQTVIDHTEELRVNAEKIVNTLNSFGVGTRIVDICRSPSVTRYELQPDPGVKISKITSLSDDIAMNLAASGVRIEAPIPNKNAVGIEVPNAEKTSVTLREIIDSEAFKRAKSKLNVALGRDIQGEPTCADLARMPHLLVAGTTGSGKSVCLNAMIISILFNATPDEVKLIMIDPKKVEFTVYRSLPHLLVPVVSDPRKAAGALSWAVAEMDKRYALFSENGVRNLLGYNTFASSHGVPKLPQIVIIIDELSDLMMAASNEVEDSICRLAQKARAAGMHLIVATQRPSVDVITGIIKANIPSRIAFAVKSQIDSRTIIDTMGAEKLLGYGDMLFCPVGLSKPIRVQGAFVSDEEIDRVLRHIKSQCEAEYDDSVMEEIERKAAEDNKKKSTTTSAEDIAVDGDDELVAKAIEVVVESGMASTTLLQRKLKLGYARAARIVDELAEKGIIGPFEGSKPRKVLITKQQWYEMQALSSAAAPRQLSLDDVASDQDDAPDEPPRRTAGDEHNYFGGASDSTDSYEIEDGDNE